MKERGLGREESGDRSSRRALESLREAANGALHIGRFRRALTDNAGVSRGMDLEAYGGPGPSYLFPLFSYFGASDWQRNVPRPPSCRTASCSSSSFRNSNDAASHLASCCVCNAINARIRGEVADWVHADGICRPVACARLLIFSLVREYMPEVVSCHVI